MITVISPSKTLDYVTPISIAEYSLPELLHQTATLITACQALSPTALSALMSISPKLAQLNYQRFQNWHADFTPANARPAIFAFTGDVYSGLQVTDFKSDDLTFAQQHLRILSGLYGLLKPLDLIQPYRLEMGTKLKNGHNRNLYQFWTESLTALLQQQLQEQSSHELINLASNEYFNVIDRQQLQADIITPVFLDESKGHYKIIGFYAKKARGLMSRYIIKHQLDHAQDIKSFNLAGYQFNQLQSTTNEWIFTRSAQQALHSKNNPR